jgi:hypothetical protein
MKRLELKKKKSQLFFTLMLTTLFCLASCIKDNVYQTPPSASNLVIVPNVATEYDGVTVSIKASDTNGLKQVTLHYRVNDGLYVTVAMTPTAEANIYSGVVPANAIGSIISLYVEVENNSGKKVFLPEGAPEINVMYIVGSPSVVMNEIFSGGTPTNPDWIELFNTTDYPIDIGGFKIFNSEGQSGVKPKLLIPSGTTIAPRSFYVVVTDVPGESGFGLPASGAVVWLENTAGSIIDKVTFPALQANQSFGRFPNGSIAWEVMTTITRGASNVFVQIIPVNINALFRLPLVLIESSGIAITAEGKIWSHNDAGNENNLHCFNTSGTLLRTITITNVVNNDWEDLAVDSQKRIYINDAGNNNNNRTNLAIYRIPDPESFAENTINAEIMSFSFEDQTAFPPPASNRNFDIEAIVWHNDSIFMFTKDRSSPFTGITKMYKIPAVPGNHIAKLAGSHYIGSTTGAARVTAADFHAPSGRLALLTNQKLVIFKNFIGSNFLEGHKIEYPFNTIPGQNEAIFFENENTILMTEEGGGTTAGYLYGINLPN